MKIFNEKDNKTALDSDNKSISYQNLREICDFQKKKFDCNQVYALAMHNDIPSVLLYLCLLYSDCTFIILDPSLLMSDWNFLNKFNIIYLLSSKAISFDSNKHIFKFKSELSISDFSYFEYKKLSKITNENRKLSSPSLLLNTSGSSGKAKLVRVTYGNLIANTEAIIRSLKLKQSDSSITTLPLFYTYGLSILNTHLYSGGKIYVTNSSILTNRFVKEFRKFKPTIISGVPSTYEIMRKLDYIYLKNDHLKKITQAGGSLDKKIQIEIIKLCKKNKSFYIMYGQTEATARISCFDITKNTKKVGSVGKSLDNLNVRIVKRRGSIEGEIVVSGPSITLGYVDSFADLLKAVSPRDLHTGDLGFLDEDGFLFITGRKSRFCKIYGRRFNLDLLEKEFSRFETRPTYIVSDDINIYVFGIKKFNNRKLKILGIKPANIKYKILSFIPFTKNGKVDYAKLLEIATNKL